MLIDLHVHQDGHSKDSQLNIDQAIEEAKAKGLDVLCITDHDDLGLRIDAERLSLKHNFLVIVGVEIYTLDGDLLCYGIDKMPNTRLSAQATIDFVHEQGGVCIAAHPYRQNNRGLKDFMFELQGLDAIEAYNGRTDITSNHRAYEAAKILNLPMTGSSDAHSEGEIGNYVTHFLDTIRNEMDFLMAIKAGRFTANVLLEDIEQSA